MPFFLFSFFFSICEFGEKLDKNFIVEVKRKLNKYEILVNAHYEDIDTRVGLVRLNELFEKYGNNDSFRKFIAT